MAKIINHVNNEPQDDNSIDRSWSSVNYSAENVKTELYEMINEIDQIGIRQLGRWVNKKLDELYG